MKETHVVIQKVKVRMHTDSKNSAYDLKDNAPAFLKNVVFEIIEDYLCVHEMDNGLNKKLTILNHLKLNLSISEHNYNSQFAALSIEQEIKKQLDAIFHSSSSGEITREFDADTENIIRYSEDEILQNSFICFLVKSTLPWYCNEEFRKRLFTEETIQLLFVDKLFIDRFLNVCRNQVTRQRFVSQLNESLVLRVFNSLYYRNKPNDDSTVGFLGLKKLFLSIGSPKDKAEIMSNILGLWYLSDSEERIRKALENIGKLLTKDAGTKTIDELMNFFKTEDFNQKKDILNQTGLKNENHSLSDQMSDYEGRNQLFANAGLILVYPFLKTFFEKLGLLSLTSQLKDPELCVHLLHYVATGIEQDYEHQLSFEKMICGVSEDTPIERFVFLTDEMKNEAENLLRAVLENWHILRNSGVKLLQDEFLRREGIIQTDEKIIQISFERKAQDILIGKLEWTLSYIKLPWLEKIIRVNW